MILLSTPFKGRESYPLLSTVNFVPVSSSDWPTLQMGKNKINVKEALQLLRSFVEFKKENKQQQERGT